MTKYERSVGLIKVIRNLFAGLGFVWVMFTMAIWLIVCIPSAFLVELSDDISDAANAFSDRIVKDLGYEKASEEMEEEP